VASVDTGYSIKHFRIAVFQSRLKSNHFNVQGLLLYFSQNATAYFYFLKVTGIGHIKNAVIFSLP
jgi:hypothetical protein